MLWFDEKCISKLVVYLVCLLLLLMYIWPNKSSNVYVEKTQEVVCRSNFPLWPLEQIYSFSTNVHEKKNENYQYLKLLTLDFNLTILWWKYWNRFSWGLLKCMIRCGLVSLCMILMILLLAFLQKVKKCTMISFMIKD